MVRERKREREAGWAGRGKGERAGEGSFGPRGEKEKRDGVWAGWAESEVGKRKVLHFCKMIQTSSTQIRIQEFESKLNIMQNKMQGQHEMQQKPIFLIFIFMAKYFI